jgi:hypothetical protein
LYFRENNKALRLSATVFWWVFAEGASTFWYRLRQMTAFSHLKLEVKALQLSATVFWWVFAEGALQKGAETDL